MTGFIGWFVGLGIIWKARCIEPLEDSPTKLPWTQRISTGSTRGATIGAFAGLILALSMFNPEILGLTGMITLGYGLGGIIGGIYEGQDDEVARRIIRKIWYNQEDSSSLLITESYSLTAQRLKIKRGSFSGSEQDDQLLPLTPVRRRIIDPFEREYFHPIFHQSSQEANFQISSASLVTDPSEETLVNGYN